MVILWNSLRFACEKCHVGHRSVNCGHIDRVLLELRGQGRPVTQCEHCRARRKEGVGHSHHRCQCLRSTVRKRVAVSCSNGVTLVFLTADENALRAHLEANPNLTLIVRRRPIKEKSSSSSLKKHSPSPSPSLDAPKAIYKPLAPKPTLAPASQPPILRPSTSHESLTEPPRTSSPTSIRSEEEEERLNVSFLKSRLLDASQSTDSTSTTPAVAVCMCQYGGSCICADIPTTSSTIPLPSRSGAGALHNKISERVASDALAALSAGNVKESAALESTGLGGGAPSLPRGYAKIAIKPGPARHLNGGQGSASTPLMASDVASPTAMTTDESRSGFVGNAPASQGQPLHMGNHYSQQAYTQHAARPPPSSYTSVMSISNLALAEDVPVVTPRTEQPTDSTRGYVSIFAQPSISRQSVSISNASPSTSTYRSVFSTQPSVPTPSTSIPEPPVPPRSSSASPEPASCCTTASTSKRKKEVPQDDDDDEEMRELVRLMCRCGCMDVEVCGGACCGGGCMCSRAGGEHEHEVVESGGCCGNEEVGGGEMSCCGGEKDEVVSGVGDRDRGGEGSSCCG